MWTRALSVLAVLFLSACGGGADGGSPGGPGFGDPRNGSYVAHAANGNAYELALNFDAGSYRMAGNGLDVSGSFGPGGNGGFAIAGNARFRTTTDLVVGGFNFGSGVLPFVAARRFVTSAAELTHTFNGLGINLTGTTPSASRIFQARFAAGGLQSCTDNVIYTVAACPAASLYTYALSVNGNEFTGVDAAHGDTIRFRVARSGNLLVYLRAETPAGGVPSFRIGLPEAAGIDSIDYFGADTLGSWQFVALSNNAYNVTATLANGGPFATSALLSALGGGTVPQPSGIRAGVRGSDNGTIFAVQGGPLAVVVGANAAPTAGYLAIGLQ